MLSVFKLIETIKQSKEVPIGCLFFVCLLASPAAAYDVAELQPLNFGVLAIPGNDSVSELEFPRSGRNLRATGSIVVIEVGNPGRYQLTNFPANTPVDISADSSELRISGSSSGEKLIVDRFDFGEVFTDDLGTAEFNVGATLATSGDGASYPDTRYDGPVKFELTFWASEEGQYVTKSFNFEIFVDLRTSFEISEVRALSFGALFARSSPVTQATLRLFPNGKYSVINDGEARIASISQPSAGIVSVSAAAPNRLLNITLDSTEIRLTNESRPDGPALLLTNLVSDPSSEARTDENGTLEIRLGGDLSTEITEEIQVYPAGDYSGQYGITVTY